MEATHKQDIALLNNSILLQREGQNYFVPASAIHVQVMKKIKERYPSLKRNDPCICGSKIKFKKCCGRVRTADELKKITERIASDKLSK